MRVMTFSQQWDWRYRYSGTLGG